MCETQVHRRPAETIDEVVQQFLDGTIDEASWTHAAHLFVCRHLLATEPDVDAAFERMCELIQIHNARVELEGAHGAFHETVTRYFVDAMAHAAPATDAALLTEPTLRRDAPRRHWSGDALSSAAARRSWVEPDLAPLPWATPVDGA